MFGGVALRLLLGGGLMPYFRCYLFDKTKHLLESTDLIAPDKTAAISRVRALFASEETWFAFELWKNARRVHKELRTEFRSVPESLMVSVEGLAPKMPAAE